MKQDKITPTTFSQCQNTKCKDCSFADEIPEERLRHHDYFEYCNHRANPHQKSYKDSSTLR